jgi:hypothetical protein
MTWQDTTADAPPPVGTAETSAGPATPGRRALRERPAILVVGVVLAYVVLILLGVTQSSLGVPSMRQERSQPLESTIGIPRDIRSDEFGVDTPLLLGLGAGGAGTLESPLAEASDVLSGVPVSGQFFASVVHFDSAAMRLGTVVPVESLFAARWWLPWVLLALALPVWLQRVGATVPMSWFATALVAAAPATAWWSAYPVRILGFAAAACVVGMAAADAFGRRRWVLASAKGVLAGLLVARLATWYIPWSITLAAPLLIATFGWLLVHRERRRAGILAIVVTGVVSIVLVAGLYLQNWDALRASMETVYPGQRRSGGGAMPAAQLFGAPAQGYFQLSPTVSWGNVSEVSSGFTLCAVWAGVLGLAGLAGSALRGRRPGGSPPGRPRRFGMDGNRWALAVLGTATTVELLWAMVDLGALGQAIPVMNRVPAGRAGGTVGFIAVMTVALVLSRRQRTQATGWRVPVLAAAPCAALTAYGAWDLATITPGLGLPLVVGASAAVFFVVVMVTRQPQRWLWTATATCVAAAGIAIANPFQIGAGDLRDSESAALMLEQGADARAEGTYWASDGTDTDVLLMATGVPSLSGVQISGPDRANWARIDPDGAFVDAWNRGGASIEMSWLPAGAPQVTVGAPDQILVAADPCDLIDRGFDLGHIVARRALTNPCLTKAGELRWNGRTRFLYRTTLTGP